MGSASGCGRVEYRPPDKQAEAIYSYKDENGKVRKQVVRYPDSGEFKQRRPGKRAGLWIWNTKGVKPLLYNLDRLQFASTVCITEGEKDADNFNRLNLGGNDEVGDTIVATTSGGSDSWKDEFADSLLGKRVIILPDNDVNGVRYAKDIVQSLHKRSIEYYLASFAGTGAKDVSEYLERHTIEELLELIGTDWIFDKRLNAMELIEP